ncbi:MAG: hypothetical protein PF961_19580 [Planctomycetota bacterium]|nr:hypothetical protein [Planctomycetota bacterium]
MALGCGEQVSGEGSNVLARYQVARGDLEVTITESGSLRSAEATHIVARTKGWLTFVIPDGSQVEEGAMLMELENSERVDKLERVRLDLGEAERNLNKAKSELKLHELEAAKTLVDAERKLRFARLELEQYEKGTAGLKENDLRLKVERAKVELEQEEDRLKRMPALLEEGFVTQSELNNSKLRVREMRQDLDTHVRNLEVFLEFERPKETERLTADVAGAEIQLERDTQSVAGQRAEKQAEVEKHTYTLERKTEEKGEVEEHVSNLVITAPRRGIVVHGNPQRRHWQAKEDFAIGDEIKWNQTVMSLPDLTDMIVEVGINEVYIDKAVVGMHTVTKIESLGESFPGEVRKIAATASQRYDVKEYKTEITMGDTGGRTFRPGMSARVTIQIAAYKDVLSVPLDAVYERDGATYVYVERGGAPVKTPVTLGDANDDFVVITEGLSEGETVLVLGIEPGEA